MVCSLLQLGLHASPLLMTDICHFRAFTHCGSWRERGGGEREDRQVLSSSSSPPSLEILAKSTCPAHGAEVLGLGECCLAMPKAVLWGIHQKLCRCSPWVHSLAVFSVPAQMCPTCVTHRPQELNATATARSTHGPARGVGTAGSCQYGHSQGIPPVSPGSV